MLPHQDKRKGQNDGSLPNPFEEKMRIERKLFREALFAKLLIRVERGVGEKMYGGNDFFFLFSKTKKRKNIYCSE